MPTYQYKCLDCSIEYEESVSIHEETPTPKCECGSMMNRVFAPTHTIWRTTK